MRRVIILGSTGSIGTQALDVISRNPDQFQVVGLAAGRNRTLLSDQARRFHCVDLAVATPVSTGVLSGTGLRVRSGPHAAAELVRDVEADVVLNGITGAVGLEPTLETLKAGVTLALANKESLIVGGPLVKALEAPGQIVPVDSEHSAIAQALAGGRSDEVRRLLVTASGGPFRGRRREEMRDVTPEEALHHPTWHMGRVVTTNSATLVNKGLEIIEAHLLFDVPFDRIDVVVHPQSHVHSMVEFVDGSVLAQVSPPDMRLPISLGLDWPHRIPHAIPPLDWTHTRQWTFEPLDDEAFPAVRLARRCGEAGATFPAVYNAANEVAVDAFHARRIGFLDIVDTIERVVDEHRPESGGLDLEAVLDADRWARDRAGALLGLI